MMRSRVAAVALGLCVCLSARLSFAEDKGKDNGKKEPAKVDPEEMQKLFEKYATPGKEHKNLRRLVGRWTAEITSYDGPKPTKSKGSSRFRAIMGGRYVVQNYKGTFMGKSFEGMGISGYDNAQKKYVSVWLDSMGTGFMNSTGKYDEKTNTLTEVGKFSSPIGEMTMKMVSQYKDKDHFTMTMYMVSPEGEKKSMEIKYTRSKGKGPGDSATAPPPPPPPAR